MYIFRALIITFAIVFCTVLLLSNQIIAAENVALTMRVTPKDARIRVMNIKPSYKHGIKIKPGLYHIVIDKKGFETWDKWLKVDGISFVYSVELKPKESASSAVQTGNTSVDQVRASAKPVKLKTTTPINEWGRLAPDDCYWECKNETCNSHPTRNTGKQITEQQYKDYVTAEARMGRQAPFGRTSLSAMGGLPTVGKMIIKGISVSQGSKVYFDPSGVTANTGWVSVCVQSKSKLDSVDSELPAKRRAITKEYFGEYICGDTKSKVSFRHDIGKNIVTNFSIFTSCTDGSGGTEFSGGTGMHLENQLQVMDTGRIVDSGRNATIGYFRKNGTAEGELAPIGMRAGCRGRFVDFCLKWVAKSK